MKGKKQTKQLSRAADSTSEGKSDGNLQGLDQAVDTGIPLLDVLSQEGAMVHCVLPDLALKGKYLSPAPTSVLAKKIEAESDSL